MRLHCGHRLGEMTASPCRIRISPNIEKNGFAAEAGIDPRLKQPAHLRTEGALRARLAGYVIFLRAQLPAPFRFRLNYLAIRGGIASLGKV